MDKVVSVQETNVKNEDMSADFILSVVIPCLNEENTIADCIMRATTAINKMGITGEVVVVDNGSTDKSVEIAENLGARTVFEHVKGYGSALRRGFREARGQYVIMGDADCTYDFSKIKEFVELLEQDVDLVMGSRLAGKISPGAMPWLHRRVGTPFLTKVLNWFYNVNISDVNCGMRGFRRSSIESLCLECNGMEFASEMLVRAGQKGLSIKEIPINYHTSPVKRTPNLRTFSDGWRHLRLILLGSPKHIFLNPGLLLLLFGLFLIVCLFNTDITIFRIPLGLSTTVFAYGCVLIGVQIILFGICAMVLNDMDPGKQDRVRVFLRKHFTLEKGLILGTLFLGLGIAMGITAIILLLNQADPPNIHVKLTQLAVLAVFTVLIGLQIAFSSMYIGLLDRKRTLE
jgi:glycosyltransferase involved in cell wall biosynthesis